ncbi:hypothetical protein [Thermococcus stetteri]|uniref:hypothetical protein n=1 Tax=Thermococcus stetteri TaxID=49900 RepID=UPI001AE1E38D|nr:hypothetical protein [Thermococcus stetteri]MBP1911239.1 hypothetical protein [Thermococcus stetteri]
MKVDGSGRPVWARTYNVSAPDAERSLFFDALPVENGFLLLGYSFDWFGPRRVVRPILFNMSASGDVVSANVLNVESSPGFVSAVGDGWMALGLNTENGGLAVVRISEDGSVREASRYRLPDSISGGGEGLSRAFTSYVYPARDVDVLHVVHHSEGGKFEWMVTLKVRDGKVISCLNSTNPLAGKGFAFSAPGTPENPGAVYGVFFGNLTYVEAPGSEIPSNPRLRPLVRNASVAVLDPERGMAYVKPLPDNVTYALVSSAGVIELTADNRSIITVFDFFFLTSLAL